MQKTAWETQKRTEDVVAILEIGKPIQIKNRVTQMDTSGLPITG